MAITSYQDIKAMSAEFKAMLENNKTSLPFDVDNSALVVLVDVEKNLNAILSRNPAKLAVAIGLENGRLTICLLGADSEGQPLTRERSVLSASDPQTKSTSDPNGEPDDGQETWPEEEIITPPESTEYNQFFL
jgi:hypothetical protein